MYWGLASGCAERRPGYRYLGIDGHNATVYIRCSLIVTVQSVINATMPKQPCHLVL